MMTLWRHGRRATTSATQLQPNERLIAGAVLALTHVIVHLSQHGRRKLCKAQPGLPQWLLNVGGESNPRHKSTLAYVGCACLLGAREPSSTDEAAGAGAAALDKRTAQMAQVLCTELQVCRRRRRRRQTIYGGCLHQ
jgi:hypothetical protein